MVKRFSVFFPQFIAAYTQKSRVDDFEFGGLFVPSNLLHPLADSLDGHVDTGMEDSEGAESEADVEVRVAALEGLGEEGPCNNDTEAMRTVLPSGCFNFALFETVSSLVLAYLLALL